jgi:hypothetical protein
VNPAGRAAKLPFPLVNIKEKKHSLNWPRDLFMITIAHLNPPLPWWRQWCHPLLSHCHPCYHHTIEPTPLAKIYWS